MPRGQYDRNAAQALGAGENTASDVETLAPRAEEMRRERRRRNDGDLDRMASMKLAIPHHIQEQARREGKVVRWIMDNRMSEAHANDWDKVDEVAPVQANPMAGTDERLVLCSKFADWHAEDQRRDDQHLDDRDANLMAGKVSDAEGRSADGIVVPKGQVNRITQQTGL